MAEKKRKSTRNFNLEKPVERHFDIEKDEIDVGSPVTPVSSPTEQNGAFGQQATSCPPETPDNVASNETGRSSGGSKKWIAAVAGLLVAGGLAYYFAGGNPQNDDEGFAPSEKTITALADSTERAVEETDSAATALISENKSGESGVLSGPSSENDQNGPQQETSQKGANEKRVSTSPGENNSSPGNIGIVQEKATTSPSVKVSNDNTADSGTIEEEARKVLDGVYGNNPERKRLLGAKYNAIQKRVNEMYRKGLVR